MEIRTDIFQKEQANNDYKMVSSALFLMAARNTNEYSKPYLVPKIKFDYEIDHKGCMLRYELGKLNQDQRKKLLSTTLFKSPPTEQETLELLFKK